MNHLLKAAVDLGVISKPHVSFVPNGFPLSIAVSALQLPAGCEAPKGQPCRVGTAIHPSKEQASIIAMAEAAERYSLQFDPELPAEQWPISAFGGPADPLSATALRLGAPGGRATSIGCATFDALEPAAERAALEHFEHIALTKGEADASLAQPLDLGQVPQLVDLMSYLADRLRDLRAEVIWPTEGIAMVRVICCDPNGARPTEGSAASTSIETAATKAAHEAILSWRNMIELERSGMATPRDSTSDLLLAYRGASNFIHPIEAPAHYISPENTGTDRTGSILDRLHRATGKRIRVFDMTHPALSIPVARIVLG